MNVLALLKTFKVPEMLFLTKFNEMVIVEHLLIAVWEEECENDVHKILQ